MWDWLRGVMCPPSGEEHIYEDNVWAHVALGILAVALIIVMLALGD